MLTCEGCKGELRSHVMKISQKMLSIALALHEEEHFNVTYINLEVKTFTSEVDRTQRLSN